MKEVVEYIARYIADKPDEVKVTEIVEDEGITLRLEVASEDKGRIIGKQGRMAQAMRTLLRVAAMKKGVHVTLEIV